MAKTRVEQVVKDIRSRISSGEYAPHERIPSEVKLQEEYGVSGDTVRKALVRLTTEGAIYRLPWKGSFVSPPAKVGRILVVANYATVVPADNFGLLYGFSAFGHGMRCYEDQHSVPYALILMDRDTYMRSAYEIHLIHRDIAGIIFFRDVQPVLATRPQLEQLGIPFLFYGSDRCREQLLGENIYCYSEESLVSLALEYLTGKGHTKILCTRSDAVAGRYRIYEAWMRQRGLWSDDCGPIEIEDGRMMISPSELVKRGTALLGARDKEAVVVLNAAVRAGIAVPESLAVMGIDNYPIGTHTVVPLTSVDIPIMEDAERCTQLFIELLEGKRKTISERSRIRVVERESV
jgi:GntR family transcriptional regulator of arabinose operon